MNNIWNIFKYKLPRKCDQAIGAALSLVVIILSLVNVIRVAYLYNISGSEKTCQPLFQESDLFLMERESWKKVTE